MPAARTDNRGYWIGFAVVLALLFVAPLVLPEFWRRFTTEILIWGLLAMSSDILIGYTGMVSFGPSAFFGLGMYGAAAALRPVLQSIRENEPRTRAIGYAVERYKIVAVMLSGVFAGLAGVLYAVQNKFAAPDFVFFLISGEVVIFNVLGGMGTLVGPIAGAAFFLILRETFSRFWTEFYLIPVGVIFTLMVIFVPQGLLGFARRALNR